MPRARIKVDAAAAAAIVGKAPGKAARTRKAKGAAPREPLPPDAVLLALDPSSTAIGWSVFVGSRVRAAGVISHPKGWAASRRIRRNAWKAADLIGTYDVTHILVESQSHKHAGGKFAAQGLATLGKAQGYLMGVVEERWPDIALEEVDERTWTRWGGKNLSKPRRAEIVASLVPEYAEALRADAKADGGMDCMDALGLALWRLGVIR